MIDPTINVGHVITVLGGIIAAIGTVYLLRTDIRVFAVRMDAMEKILSGVQLELKNMGQVIINQALQDERMRDYGRRLDQVESRLGRVEGRVLGQNNNNST